MIIYRPYLCVMCKSNENLFDHIEDIVRQVYIKEATSKQKDITRKLDCVLLNRWLAIPIFLIIMLGIFYLTFVATGWLSNLIRGLITDITIPALAQALLAISACLLFECVIKVSLYIFYICIGHLKP